MSKRRKNPSPMSKPTVLYRAVSLPEFVHVMKTGKFTGGANGFNPYDKRKFVFFGDKIDADLIWQGEEIDRQAEYALREDPLHEQFEEESDPKKREKIRKKYHAKVAKMTAKIKKKLAKLAFTSVIFETIPIVGAEVFGHGETGFSDREYGFESNVVDLYDVYQVWLVQNGHAVQPVSVSVAREIAASIESKLWST